MHWTSFVIINEKDGRKLYYYDALGVGPFLKEHVEFINDKLRPGDVLRFNKSPVQHPDSDACGYHAINFLLHMQRGGDFDEFFNQFGPDLRANDRAAKHATPIKKGIKGSGQISSSLLHSK